MSIAQSDIRAAIEQAVERGSWEYARALLARGVRHPGPSKIGPDDIERLRHTIEMALVNESDWPQATIRWRETLAEFPDEPAIWPFAASCFIQSSAFADAENVLRLMCDQQPDNVENWMYFAINAEHQHRWTDAVERWNRVVALRPDDARMKTLRGDAIWNSEMLATDSMEEDAA